MRDYAERAKRAVVRSMLAGVFDDLLDANETIWAFGLFDSVGDVGNPHITALERLSS